eukprot:gb/GFBE01030351.1/.p1 GENE.gb/GFBE01030351.1/~~gb/GFBE01030351.1/.p1  ORF type:complete len:115 (+),score=3.92 gb/GFBE01030351.1/:1-345(+)
MSFNGWPSTWEAEIAAGAELEFGFISLDLLRFGVVFRSTMYATGPWYYMRFKTWNRRMCGFALWETEGRRHVDGTSWNSEDRCMWALIPEHDGWKIVNRKEPSHCFGAGMHLFF